MVRDGAFGFANAETGGGGMGGFGDPGYFFDGFLGDGGGKFAHDVFFELGPEFQKRHGAVEAHVERFVVGIVVALHEGVDRRSLRIGTDWTSPERAGVRERVEVVAEHAAIPQWLALVVDVERLARMAVVAPSRAVG